MRKIYTILIVAFSFMPADAQVARPLPKLIQNLSDEDYFIWAQWQNRQAVRRFREIDGRTRWDKYDYASRVVSSNFSRGNATTQTSGTSHSSSRAGSRSTSRSGYANTNINRLGGAIVTSYRIRFRNPDYVSPGPTTAYNPWTRCKGGLGTPDWENLFVPCKEGTITMQEVLDQLIGPQNPEKVFKIMLEGYFGN
jgi:hypothetical protein